MNDVRQLITPNYKRLNNEITDIVASRMHYFERMDDSATGSMGLSEIANMTSGSIDRYRADYVFRAKVMSIASDILRAIQSEHDDRLSEFGGDTGLFKIVEI